MVILDHEFSLSLFACHRHTAAYLTLILFPLCCEQCSKDDRIASALRVLCLPAPWFVLRQRQRRAISQTIPLLRTLRAATRQPLTARVVVLGTYVSAMDTVCSNLVTRTEYREAHARTKHSAARLVLRDVRMVRSQGTMSRSAC